MKKQTSTLKQFKAKKKESLSDEAIKKIKGGNGDIVIADIIVA